MNNNWQNKKVLITGANGFVGSNAVDYFSKLGAKVTAVIHNQNTNINQNPDISIKKADLLDPDDAQKIVQGQDIVLNFAALDGSLEYKKNHSAELFSANMRITLNMLEAAIKNNIETFLLVGSADVYSSTNKPINEETPIHFNWDQKADGYKLAKWVAELACREFINQYQLNTVIVRPSNLYGPKDQFSDDERLRFIPSVIKNIFRNTPITIWGTGKQSRTFLYITDFLKICQKLIENKVFNNPVNIAGSQTISLLELANLITKLTKKDAEIITDHEKPGGAMGRQFDVTKLKKLIGEYEETPYTQGLEQTINYYLQQIKK